MEFIYPWYLVGLAAISIPIVIHLFNFHRYKKVYFTNVRFLQAIQSETHRSSRLRNLILLLLRILFIITLVLAFAQPYIPASNNIKQGNPFAVSIYLDNSQSMETGMGNENLLHQAREKALEIVNSFSSTDKFQVLTNDLEGKYQHFVPANEASICINDVKSSLAQVSTSTLLQTQANLLRYEKNYNHLAFFISDFARSTFSLPTNLDTNITWIFIPMQSPLPLNVSIDTCWFDTPIIAPGLESVLRVNVTNHSANQSRELMVKLSTNEIQRGLKPLSLTPKTTFTLSFPLFNADTGTIMGSLQINDNGFTFDDELYFAYTVHPKLEILIVNNSEGENPHLNQLFHSDSLMWVDNQPIHQLIYSRLEKSSLTILNELTEYPQGLILSVRHSLNAGHSVAILPHPSKGIDHLERFLSNLGAGLELHADTSSTTVSQVNTDHFIFKPAIERMPNMPLLPSVKKYFKINLNSRSGYDNLMTLRNGDPFLIAKRLGNGHLFFQASPLRPEFTDFMRNNLFVAAYLNMAISGQYQNPLYAVYGKPSIFYFEKPAETTPAPHLIKSDNTIDIIPFFRDRDGQTEIIVRNELPEPGIYHLRRNNKTNGFIALNAPRTESLPTCFSVDELDRMLEQKGWTNSIIIQKDDSFPIRSYIAETIQGKKLWRIFLFAALILLASEVILLRFWK